jgi:DNA-directed RNA polymerase I, II, and III subunit RPABC2
LIKLSENVRIGPPNLTRFERARIIGARALQLTLGAPMLTSVDGKVSDAIDIALIELKAGVLPITLRRILPDNSRQDIALSTLMKPRIY